MYEGRGELLAVPGRTSGGAGGGVRGCEGRPVRLARFSPGPPGSAQVRRLGEDRANFLPGHALARHGAHRRGERKAAGALRGPGHRGEAAGNER